MPTTTTDWKKHMFDLVKGAIGAALTAAAIALVQYLGAHVPDLMHIILSIAGGTVGVKIHS